MPNPPRTNRVPAGSRRKFKRCHGAETAAGTPRAPSAEPSGNSGYDPFAKVFRDDGAIDVEYAGEQIPALVDLLRKQPTFFEFRVDTDSLAERLLADN